MIQKLLSKQKAKIKVFGTGGHVMILSRLEQRKTSVKGRLDLRKQSVFTIDGESAKDLDDAVLHQGRELLRAHAVTAGQYSDLYEKMLQRPLI